MAHHAATDYIAKVYIVGFRPKSEWQQFLHSARYVLVLEGVVCAIDALGTDAVATAQSMQAEDRQRFTEAVLKRLEPALAEDGKPVSKDELAAFMSSLLVRQVMGERLQASRPSALIP